MKIAFNTNDRIRKLAAIWDRFNPDGSLVKELVGYSRFFGEDFYAASSIYIELDYISEEPDGLGKLLSKFLDRNAGKINKNGKFTKISALLDKFHMPMADEKDAFLLETEKSFIRDWKKYESKIAKAFRILFGFELPEKVDIILDSYQRRGIHGTELTSNPPILLIQMNKDSKRGRYSDVCIPVLLHELLHALVEKNKAIDRNMKENALFEEALLDYFAPKGILDEKIGIIKSLDVNGAQKEAEKQRPEASAISRKLLPYVKEYCSMQSRQTIWTFLKEKDFKMS